MPVEKEKPMTNPTPTLEPEITVERIVDDFIHSDNQRVFRDQCVRDLKSLIADEIARAEVRGFKVGIEECQTVISEEFTVAYPDPHKGFRDMVEVDVETLCDRLDIMTSPKKEP